MKNEQGERPDEYETEPLNAISDRLEEAWEPLLAIAELAGDPWPTWAKAAAVALIHFLVTADQGDRGVLLLTALTTIFGARAALHTSTLCTALNDDASFRSGRTARAWGSTAAAWCDCSGRFGFGPRTS